MSTGIAARFLTTPLDHKATKLQTSSIKHQRNFKLLDVWSLSSARPVLANLREFVQPL